MNSKTLRSLSLGAIALSRQFGVRITVEQLERKISHGQIKSEMNFNEDVQGLTKMFSETGLDISNGEGLGYEDISYRPKQGYYLNGLKEGKWEDEDGGFDTYQKGKKEGPSIDMFGRSNCTWKVGSYINDKKEGEWMEYKYCKEDDDPYVITNYKNGEIIEN